jgi:hypothetical protein
VIVVAYSAYSWNSARVQDDARLHDTVNRHTDQIDKNDDRLTRVEATVNKIDGKVDTVIKILTKQESADDAVARGNK